MQTYSTTPSRNVARAATAPVRRPASPIPVGIINRAMQTQKPNPPGKK